MTDFDTIAIKPLSADELRAMRLRANADRSFDARFAQAARLGFLSATRRPGLDPEISLGLALAAEDALVVLIGTPAPTGRDMRRKIRLLRSWTGATPHPILLAVMTAAIVAEVGRLHQAPRAGR